MGRKKIVREYEKIIWTEDLVSKFKELHLSGVTLKKIAEEFKTSKNAIVGKARRLGLLKRNPPEALVGAYKARVAAIQARSEKIKVEKQRLKDAGLLPPKKKQVRIRNRSKPEAKPKPKGEPVTPVFDAPKASEKPEEVVAYVPMTYDIPPRHSCLWPEGNPGYPGFRFCLAYPVVKDTPYCEAHCQRAYVNFKSSRAVSHRDANYFLSR